MIKKGWLFSKLSWMSIFFARTKFRIIIAYSDKRRNQIGGMHSYLITGLKMVFIPQFTQ